jgi:hypothetical protein
MLTSALNACLWVAAVAPRHDWWMVVGAAFSTSVFVVGLLVGFISPVGARFVWPLAFFGTIITSIVERKKG